VSVLISTYRSGEFIQGCLQDLVEQSIYKKGKLEIIIIDSASPENEGDIAEKFQKRYDHIVYERTAERETLYKAWNRGIQKARGRYLSNANTDDRRRFDALEVLADYLDCHPEVSVVYSDQLITDIKNETFAYTQARRHWNWPDYSFEKMKQACCVGSQPMWRASLHQQYGYFREELSCAGDYEFWLRIGEEGVKMARLPEILGLYYLNTQGLEHGTGGQALREHYQICRQYGIPCSETILDQLPPPPSIEQLGVELTDFERKQLRRKARKSWQRELIEFFKSRDRYKT
jgi:glycosyltransferase involved in cell wall biosynthesis